MGKEGSVERLDPRGVKKQKEDEGGRAYILF